MISESSREPLDDVSASSKRPCREGTSGVEALRDRLALPRDWDVDELTDMLGERRGVRVARIPKGTKVDFLHGWASGQYDEIAGALRPGGGEQFRFRDFDPEWVVEDRVLPKSPP